MRTPAAAMMKTNTARMIKTIRPAVMRSLSFAYERGGAPDLEDVHARPRLDDLVLVVGARRPDLAPQLDAPDPLGVGDALDDGRRLADQRRGARADLPARAPVLAGDRAQRGEQDDRDDEEGGELGGHARAHGGQQRSDGGSARE